MKRAKGKVDEATTDLKEALTILKEILDKSDGNDMNVGTIYIELGELALDNNLPSEALTRFESAMKIWLGIFGNGEMADNEWVASTYGFMARCHKAIGNTTLAEENERKCMYICDKIKKK